MHSHSQQRPIRALCSDKSLKGKGRKSSHLVGDLFKLDRLGLVFADLFLQNADRLARVLALQADAAALLRHDAVGAGDRGLLLRAERLTRARHLRLELRLRSGDRRGRRIGRDVVKHGERTFGVIGRELVTRERRQDGAGRSPEQVLGTGALLALVELSLLRRRRWRVLSFRSGSLGASGQVEVELEVVLEAAAVFVAAAAKVLVQVERVQTAEVVRAALDLTQVRDDTRSSSALFDFAIIVALAPFEADLLTPARELVQVTELVREQSGRGVQFERGRILVRLVQREWEMGRQRGFEEREVESRRGQVFRFLETVLAFEATGLPLELDDLVDRDRLLAFLGRLLLLVRCGLARGNVSGRARRELQRCCVLVARDRRCRGSCEKATQKVRQ